MKRDVFGWLRHIKAPRDSSVAAPAAPAPPTPKDPSQRLGLGTTEIRPPWIPPTRPVVDAGSGSGLSRGTWVSGDDPEKYPEPPPLFPEDPPKADPPKQVEPLLGMTDRADVVDRATSFDKNAWTPLEGPGAALPDQRRALGSSVAQEKG